MKTILLTSAGMQVAEEIKKILPKPANEMKLAYIVTAVNAEEDKSYSVNDRKKLLEAGFEVEDVDLDGKDDAGLRNILSGKDIIYVQGGNTFYLLKCVKESGFDKIVKELIDKGVIYIGVSAGSIIASPTIQIAAWKGGDRNDVGITDLSSMNLVDFDVFVHCEASYDDTIRRELRNSKYPLRAITNDQAILVNNDGIKFVGLGAENKFEDFL